MKNSHKYFANTECRYFPCHDNTASAPFNCLFCYCPLYSLGEHCGGAFEYVGESHNVKCCSNCDFPHDPNNYGLVTAKLKEVMFTHAPLCPHVIFENCSESNH